MNNKLGDIHVGLTESRCYVNDTGTLSPRYLWSRQPLAAVAFASLLGTAGSANAIPIDVGNRDFQLRWDNTLRYSLGARMEGRDSKISHSSSADEGDNKFDRGEVITNRLDLLSEFDMVYKRKHGFRVSAAGWYDNAYDDTSVENKVGRSSYDNNVYSSTTKRYYRGPSGELLDAFAFTQFNLGDIPVNVKIGRHSVVWGEGLLLGAHAISFRQAPSDGRKGAENPSAETKELFLPVGQISFQSSISDTVSLGGQYFYEWDPNRFPEGGTYLGSTDYLWEGPDSFNGGLRRIGAKTPNNAGEYGLNLRWSPEWMSGGTWGLYYREFNERQGWLQTLPTQNAYRLVYAENTKLYGVSFSKLYEGISIGSEISYRRNAALNGSADLNEEGPRGNTWHGVVNAVASINGGSLFDTSTLSGELGYSRLAEVTEHKELYRGVGYSACAGQNKWNGCATDDVVQGSVRFSPQWLGVADGVDITMPVALTYGIYGNGATLGGGNQGNSTYSIGVEADINKFYKASLTWADSYAHYKDNNSVVTSGNGPWALNDRGRVTLTLKATY